MEQRDKDALMRAIHQMPSRRLYRALLGQRKDDPTSIEVEGDPTSYYVRLWEPHDKEWKLISVRHLGFPPDVNTAVDIQLDKNRNWIIITLSSEPYDELRDSH